MSALHDQLCVRRDKFAKRHASLSTYLILYYMFVLARLVTASDLKCDKLIFLYSLICLL